jgi:hypothetical protein
MASVSTRDRDIISKSFRLLSRGVDPAEVMDQMNWDTYFNVFSSATGDNRYVNPVPQSSPYTDPRYGRFMQTREGGMGPNYKRTIDDNATLLTITPGVPQFAGLLQYISSMFSPSAAIIANKGRAPGFAFYMGQAITSIAFVGMQMLSASVQFLNFLLDNPKNTFWSVKPAMGAYTMASTGVLNDIMLKLGYIDPILPKRIQEQHDPLYGLKPDYDNTKAVADLRLLIPDSVNEDGTIDLMRLIMKGTRKHRVMLHELAKLDNEALTTVEEKISRSRQILQEVEFDESTWVGEPSQNFIEQEMGTVGRYRDGEANYVEQDSAYTDKAAYQNVNNAESGINQIGSAQSAGADGTVNRSFDQILNESMTNGSYGSGNPNEPSGRPSPATSPNLTNNPNIAGGQQINYEDNPDKRTWAGDVFDLLRSAAYGGMDAITWKVDGATGPTSDSFNNSHAASPMASKFNSAVKAATDFRFDVANGATGIDIIDGVVNMVKEGVTGMLSGTVVGNIPLALVNNSYVKIPDHWDGSTANLHKESFSMFFNCNYAHPYEQIMKIWIPFALFLPMVAPFSAGAGTYTSPFMCRAFSQGRLISRTSMIDNATISFGVGDRWTRDRKPLTMKIDFSIYDLEPLVSVPIDRSISVLDATNLSGLASRVLTDDTAYNNYISRITGLPYLDTILKYQRINRGLTGMVNEMKTSIRADNIASKVSDSIIGSFSTLFARPMAR